VANFPKQVKIFTASFVDVGQTTERLRIFWTYPLGVPNEFYFTVGTQCFLEDPTDVNLVPDEQLLGSLSMSGVLSGSRAGTTEWRASVTGQDTRNFQTIVGEVRLKPETSSFLNPQPVDDLTIGPAGTVYDVTFQRGTGSNVKVVRTDAWSLSDYDNRVDSGAHAVYCVPGFLHKTLGLKKSQLGAADSTNRQAVIDAVTNQYFWV
jgi:hypothetical protein